MPVPIFPWHRSWHINVWRMEGRNVPTLILLLFTVAFIHHIKKFSAKTDICLETNSRANFPMAENLAYQCMENGGEKHAHADIFVAHCGFQAQY